MVEDKVGLPSIEKLLELEKKARKDGSGINDESISGLWEFHSVWKQGSNKENTISSTLLQVLSASLELKINSKKAEDKIFTIINSIQFGLLTLKFIGSANLERKQPLLLFSFDYILIKFSSFTIFKRSLPKPQLNKRPFFALIALDIKGKWLSARGKGGGIALWERSADPIQT
tara:strand:+ start:412 stop:930 length:519 start_codon:yes stop_codon:yes gene_type:complete